MARPLKNKAMDDATKIADLLEYKTEKQLLHIVITLLIIKQEERTAFLLRQYDKFYNQ